MRERFIEGDGRSLSFLVITLLTVVVLVAYWPVLGNQFVYDDYIYITNNPHILGGLTPQNFQWAFSSFYAANWHPVAWLSHLVDVQLFGLDPIGHHAVNLFIHYLNSLLLFALLKFMTGAAVRSAVVASLWAIHPLNVETVAWASERKEVLAAFFAFLTMASYTAYVRGAGKSRYALATFLYALSLMSKPMWVSLPFILLLLDFWPLRRVSSYRTQTSGTENNIPIRTPAYLILEKSVFFALASISCIITLIAQSKGGAVMAIVQVPFSQRLINASISYVKYLERVIWPRDLAALYPLSANVSMWGGILSALLVIVGVSLSFYLWRKGYPFTGSLWYFGTLVPVIGLVQVGIQSMADRYAYVPLVGLFVVIVWGAYEVSSRLHLHAYIKVIPLVVYFTIMLATTRHQVSHWYDDQTLFEQALRATSRNWVAHNNLGLALMEKGDIEGAILHYTEALNIFPDYGDALLNMGVALDRAGRHDESLQYLKNAQRQMPSSPDVYYNLGSVLLREGRASEAIAYFTKTIDLNSKHMKAHLLIGQALAGTGKLAEAEKHFFDAIEINPNDPETHYIFAITRAMEGRYTEAIDEYRKVITLAPGHSQAHNSLGVLLAQQGKYQEAISAFREALRIDPQQKFARSNLTKAIIDSGTETGQRGKKPPQWLMESY